MQTFSPGRFSKKVYNNFEPIMKWVQIHSNTLKHLFVLQIISNYLTLPPQKKILIIIITQSIVTPNAVW